MMDVDTATAKITLPRVDAGRRVAVLGSLLLILLAGLSALFLMRGVDAQLRDVTSAYELRSRALQLQSALSNAEAAQRGYLLTRDDGSLERFRVSIVSIADQFSSLETLAGEGTEQQSRVAALAEPLEQQRADLEEAVRLGSSGRTGEALALVRLDAEQGGMEELRQAISALIAEEGARLDAHDIEVNSYRQFLVVAILVALAGSATLAYALLTRSQRELSALSESRSLLLNQNELLEAHVRERTREAEEARAHAEQERARVEALLQDTSHRIGNSLATVSSLLALQVTRTRSDEVKAVLEAAQNRVLAIASSHRRLRLGADLETVNADEFLSSVIEDVRANQVLTKPITFTTELQPLVLKARDATSLGIILGELITNATKHAFSERVDGTIWIRFGSGVDGHAFIAVEDDGVGLGDGPVSEHGLGAVIVRQLAFQFGGEPVYEARSGGGTRVLVHLPELTLVRESPTEHTDRH